MRVFCFRAENTYFSVMIRAFYRKYVCSTSGIALLLAATVFTITRLGRQYPQWIEHWYAQALYPRIISVLASVNSVFPFSLDDAFYAGLLVLFLVLISLLIVRKMRWGRFFKLVFITVAIVYSLFHVLWGFNYYRNDLATRLKLAEPRADVDELMSVFESLIEATNASYTPVYTFDRAEATKLVAESYKQQSAFLKVDVSTIRFAPKSISMSRFFAAGTIGGYYGPFFGEVHINHYLLPVEVPVVLAHEMAHQLGITIEAEANFYAWYVCSQSHDERLVYGANLYLLRYFANACSRYEGYNELVQKIRYEVRNDFNRSYYHWMTMMNQNVDRLTTKVNDAYLKSNNVEDGIDSYKGVIKYVMAYKTSE